MAYVELRYDVFAKLHPAAKWTKGPAVHLFPMRPAVFADGVTAAQVLRDALFVELIEAHGALVLPAHQVELGSDASQHGVDLVPVLLHLVAHVVHEPPTGAKVGHAHVGLAVYASYLPLDEPRRRRLKLALALLPEGQGFGPETFDRF